LDNCACLIVVNNNYCFFLSIF